MKRMLTLFAVSAPLLLLAAAPDRDVDRNGRIDMDDVRALGRMVAGLDPADLAFDQNGDGQLTTEDISRLYELVGSEGAPPAPAVAPPAAPAPTSRSDPTPPPTPPAHKGREPGARYLVVEQAADGRVVVAVGAAGVRPGDRVLGVYRTLEAADRERARLSGAGTAPSPAPSVPPAAPPRTAHSPEPQSSPAQRNPSLVGVAGLVPLEPGVGLAIGADGRTGWIIRQGPSAAPTVTLRRQSLVELTELGTPAGSVAPFFDSGGTLTGVFGFSAERGEGRILAGLGTANGPRSKRVTMSPTLRGGGRGVSVLSRRGERGETTAVYLYHWPSGTALYAPGLTGGRRQLRSSRLSGFPVLSARPLLLPVWGSRGATRSFVLIDPSAGSVWCVLNVRPDPEEPKPVRTSIRLGPLAPPNTAGGLALAASPLIRADGTSSDALVVEARSGRLGVLVHDDDPGAIRLDVLDETIDAVLPAEGPPRRLSAMPLARRGSALVLDATSGRVAVVRAPSGMPATVEPATVAR